MDICFCGRRLVRADVFDTRVCVICREISVNCKCNPIKDKKLKRVCLTCGEYAKDCVKTWKEKDGSLFHPTTLPIIFLVKDVQSWGRKLSKELVCDTFTSNGEHDGKPYACLEAIKQFSCVCANCRVAKELYGEW